MKGLFVVGVDGGGSKTSAVVLDSKGQVLGRGLGGPANYHHLGLARVGDNLRQAMAAAAEAAGCELGHVAAVTWALAGAGRSVDRELLAQLATDLLPGIPLQIEHDGVAALVGGLSQIPADEPPHVGRHGIVLIAGTGQLTYGENKNNERARAGGWGYRLERGSAYYLALETLRAVNDSADQGGPPTCLTQRVLQQLKLERPSDTLTWLYAPERHVAEVAALTPLLLAEAESGDLVAVKVALEGATYLADTVVSVARKLGLSDRYFRLVLGGSLLTGAAFFRRLVIQAVQARLPFVQPILPAADAAVGAALLALESLGLTRPLADDGTAEVDPLWTTERVNLIGQQLDMYPTLTLVGLMHLQDRQAALSLWPELPAIAAAVEAITERMKQGGRLIYVGAGTSGRLGVLDASECPPTFNTHDHQVVGLIAGGESAITRAIEGAEDITEAGSRDLESLQVGPLDAVVGLTASGRTPYVLGAMQTAGSAGALTVAVTCNLPAPITEYASHVIAPLVGPEILSGSTRLKSGTVQKLVLNMFSTAVMVRLGKTYGNLMVDLQPNSRKLRARARRIVAQACHISDEEAAEALAACQGEVKVAIVSTLARCSADEARQRLVKAGGTVRQALVM